VFRLGEYQQFLNANATSIQASKQRQQAAFEAERQRWVESGQLGFASEPSGSALTLDGGAPLADGHQVVESHIPGNVWKVAVAPGDRVRRGDALVVLESMKMEVQVESALDGIVTELCVRAGQAVAAGQRLMVVRESGAA
jgi:urea carboxylase